MVCQACGAPVANEVHFCPRCGVQVAAPAVYAGYPASPQMLASMSRVRRHLQTVGILWCVFGAYRVVSGLVGMFFLRAVTMHGYGGWMWGRHFARPFGPPWMGALMPVVAVVTVVAAGLALLVGYSLLTRQSWGRVLAIVVAILTLLKFPFGTALGIYTLWVLAPSMSGAEYEAIAEPRM
jgi:type IV secretory pathway VirB2 component (pilin)